MFEIESFHYLRLDHIDPCTKEGLKESRIKELSTSRQEIQRIKHDVGREGCVTRAVGKSCERWKEFLISVLFSRGGYPGDDGMRDWPGFLLFMGVLSSYQAWSKQGKAKAVSHSVCQYYALRAFLLLSKSFLQYISLITSSPHPGSSNLNIKRRLLNAQSS